MGNDTLIVDRIRHTYKGGNTVLHDISMNVAQGELITLLGPSGCGKSTLLRIIAGFTQPSQGHVYLQGQDVTDMRPHRRRVNLVFQRVTLFPHLNVFENIAFGMRLARKSQREISARVDECLAMVRLEGFANRAVSELSGGQAQRVSLARALANRPEVLLLDEPLSALDLKVRLELEAELRRLHRSEGLTVVFVTHDQREALALSNRIALFNKGRIDQLAAPGELYRRPATEFAAQFVGDANVLEASVETISSNEIGISVGGFTYSVPKGLENRAKALIVLRQEDLTVQQHDGECRADGLKGKIVDVGYRGSGFSYQIYVQSLDKIIKAEIPALSETPFDIGTNVLLTWRPEAAWIIAV